MELLNIPKNSFSEWWEENSQTISTNSSPATWSSVEGKYKLPIISDISDCEGWEDVLNMNGTPAARYNHTAVWTGTEMIVWGGLNGYLNSGGRYNPATDTWTPTSTGTNLPFPRGLQTAIWTGSEMIIWGGWNGQSLSSGSRYDPVSDTWTPISSFSEPSARFFHTAIWTGQSMIIWGGTIDTNYTPQDTGGIYDPTTDTWQSTSTAGAPEPRLFHTAVWTGTEMLVWGGFDGFLTSLDNGRRYNPLSDSWLPISQTNSPIHRNQHTAVWTGSEMIVWGGEYFECNPSCDNFYLNDGGRYNPLSDTWTATSIDFPVPEPRSHTVSIWTGNKMIIWGGGQTPLNSGGAYDPTSDTWADIGSSPLDARRDHTIVWNGTEMIVWGGYGGPIFIAEPLANGARYNPSSDSWVGISYDNNIPSSQVFHSAIWTGTEMIVWGGGGLSPGSNTGGRYDPALNNWTPTSTGANVPDGRYSHTGVWSGSEMIIWGGYSGFLNSFLNSGGGYDPVSDSWTATSIGSNVPAARYYHTAIWSGNEMIIWGGTSSGPIVFNDGGRYDPMGDSWLPTSTGINVPLARYAHTSVWTGQEMIVWGGSDQNFNLLVSGGRYDPTLDTWSSTSTTNVPVPRGGHSAIWDGNEMIIWGGQSAFAPFPGYENTGGRYDPISDSWQPTSVNDAVPFGRSSHTAVWSGTEMIIWGGGHTTGGRYNPLTDSWKSTTTNSNSPASRGGHSAIWTGAKMIVWGGGFYTEPASGGIYSPDTEFITVTPYSVPDCEVGVPYNQQITATGGTPPYNFFVVAGGLPYGLSLDPLTGIISGTP
ncbi:putative Ig domain-containing protein, partial [bacterium]|nr:putative Ig domain-containing protein [bacterium]